MITPSIFHMPEVIPAGALEEWRSSLPSLKGSVPERVLEFINGVSSMLPAFREYQKEHDYITGRELLLCGMTEWDGVTIVPAKIYSLPVPKMQAVDERSTMFRIFRKRGKQGLIDYVKFQFNGYTQKKLLRHLHVEIFNEQDPAASQEFTELMAQITSERAQ